jgi:antitoxin (DNA-binding transcriptional repressor) of toxin-antitoxin stability system
MGAVGVSELRNRLRYYLRRARKGEKVIVSERGRPIAILKLFSMFIARLRWRHASPSLGSLESSRCRPARDLAGRGR